MRDSVEERHDVSKISMEYIEFKAAAFARSSEYIECAYLSPDMFYKLCQDIHAVSHEHASLNIVSLWTSFGHLKVKVITGVFNFCHVVYMPTMFSLYGGNLILLKAGVKK